MEIGQRSQVTISDMTDEGQGIGKAEGMAVFVKDAVIGDKVEIEFTKVKKNYAFAKITNLLEASDLRIKPICKYSGQCGGCALADLKYEAQLEIKEKQVKDKLIRLAGIAEPLVNPICGMEDPFRYRNKAQFPVSTGGIITRKGGKIESLGEPAIGFFKAKSHEVVNCDDCMLQSEPAMAVAKAVRQYMKDEKVTAYDSKWGKGFMRHLIVKTSKHTGDVMVVIVANGKSIPNAEKLADMIDDAIFNVPTREDGIEYNFKSLILNVNRKNTSLILGDEYISVAGENTITEKVGDLTFTISANSFYQVNSDQMKVLYDKVVDYAALTGKETVLDLYCGVGTIGLYCSNMAKEVIGIESVKAAVLDANRNAVINGIVNTRFICGNAEEELPKLLAPISEDADSENLSAIKIKGADVVILDPPRNGCAEKLLEAVIKANPERIVYVSCNAATLARDVKYLGENGYEFVEATPVDMFPWTGHVETVALMTRCGQNNK